MREKEIEKKLVKKTKALGGIAPKFVSPGHSGMPDRLVLLPGGRMGFAEVKAPGVKPRKLQIAMHRVLRRLGFKVYVLDDPEQIAGILDDIAGTAICDTCEAGRERHCPHADGIHYDAWGEGLSMSEYCPQAVDDELPF